MGISLSHSWELCVIVVSLCCSGAVRRWLGGRLSDRGGGEPAGWQQHLRELHGHQQHRGERHRWRDHVSRISHVLLTYHSRNWKHLCTVTLLKNVFISLIRTSHCLCIFTQVRREWCRLYWEPGDRRRRASWWLGWSHRYDSYIMHTQYKVIFIIHYKPYVNPTAGKYIPV